MNCPVKDPFHPSPNPTLKIVEMPLPMFLHHVLRLPVQGNESAHRRTPNFFKS
jgi:hypothetical protein